MSARGIGQRRGFGYSLKRWMALARYPGEGAVPINNNSVENQIRLWALGRSNWLFTGSLRSGGRAAAILRLIRSARLNRHDPHAYLKERSNMLSDAAGV
jgi:transposase